MPRNVICKSCRHERPHHAKEMCKGCYRALISKAYTMRRADLIAQRGEAWRKAHPERMRAMAKAYRERYKVRNGCSAGSRFQIGASIVLTNEQRGRIVASAYPCAGGKGKGSRYKIPARMNASGEIVHVWNTDIAVIA